jgi:V/A-type H+-transporting ATPase subunit E
MSTDKDNMQALARAVLHEAQADATRVVADAKAKADQIRQQAEARAADERKQILEAAKQEAADMRKQAMAAAEVKGRMLLLERREKLLAGVFDSVRERLPSVQQRKDYAEIVRALVLEAVQNIGGDRAEILADAQARQLLTDEVLAALSKQSETQLQLGKPLEGRTGVVVQSLDGHRRYDNTLEARLSGNRDALRLSVYRLLTGESA